MTFNRLESDSYVFAREAHGGQFREGSGSPYIDHPASVAAILKSYGADSETVAAGNLHDTVEDTPATLDEIERRFGKDIAFLVDGVTKIEGDKPGTMKKVQNYAGKDSRVIMVKMADIIHNLSDHPEVIKNPAEYWHSTNFYIGLGQEHGYKDMAWDLQKLNGDFLSFT